MNCFKERPETNEVNGQKYGVSPRPQNKGVF